MRYLRLLLGLSFILLFTACQQPQETQVIFPSVPRTLEVATMTLQPQEWTMHIQSYGIVQPAEEVDIAIDFLATVKTVHFKEGQKVKADKTLIQFDEIKRALQLWNILLKTLPENILIC